MEIEETRKVNLAYILDVGGRGYAKELSERIGCEPSYLSQIKTGRKNMGSSFARQVEEAIGKPRGWMDSLQLGLYSGELKALVDSQLEVEGLEENLKSFRSQQASPEGPDLRFADKVPLISWVTAGAWEEPIDNYHVGDAEDWFPCPPNCKQDTTFALMVTGDSMDDGSSQGYHDGEIIFVDGSKNEALHNSDVIVKNKDGKVTFKRLINSNGDIYLKPLNPDWPDKMIMLDEDSKIVGRVMFSGRAR